MNTSQHIPGKGIVAFRMEQPIPADIRAKLVEAMTIDNQNEIIARMIAYGTKPPIQYIGGKAIHVPQEEIMQEIYEKELDRLNLIDEEIESLDNVL